MTDSIGWREAIELRQTDSYRAMREAHRASYPTTGDYDYRLYETVASFIHMVEQA